MDNHDDLPVGSICAYGHPANGVTVRKYEDGHWRLTHTGPWGKVLTGDDLRGWTLLYNPDVYRR